MWDAGYGIREHAERAGKKMLVVGEDGNRLQLTHAWHVCPTQEDIDKETALKLPDVERGKASFPSLRPAPLPWLLRPCH